MRPGASWLSVASPAAIVGAIRVDGTAVPIPSLIRDVFTAAAAMETKSRFICKLPASRNGGRTGRAGAVTATSVSRVHIAT